MNWQEEMRMGMALIKDACGRAEEDLGIFCTGCPFIDVCPGVSPLGDAPSDWGKDSNGDEL